MPVKAPNNLPALQTLIQEGVPVILEGDAIRQDIRPLRIAIVNLMPEKEQTEIQFARLLGSSPIQVEIVLIRMKSHKSRNTSSEHLTAYYQSLDDIRDQKFDGLIVTGAPIETLPFHEVTYWSELTELFDWAQDHVYGLMTVCWGAQAALYHLYGIPKFQLKQKLFGIYGHPIPTKRMPLLHGFDDELLIPVSRYTEVRREDVEACPSLRIMAESDRSGLCLLQDIETGAVFIFNHIEYDANTLEREYIRDHERGLNTQIPENYFPDDDPQRKSVCNWRAHAHLLMCNWLNYIYQGTPYDLNDLPVDRSGRALGYNITRLNKT